MVTGTQSHADVESEAENAHQPEIVVCESAPERVVLIESGNTDGWIASDLSVEASR